MVTDNRTDPSSGNSEVSPSEAAPRGRGRPRGRTDQGEATREALFDAAIELMNEQGFEATTLRQIASRAGVTHGVVYRYFPSKRAVVMALYERLSTRFAEGAELPKGTWRARVFAATCGSLDALREHRPALRSALGVLVSPSDEGLFAPATRASRLRVQGVFCCAVEEARDRPRGDRAAVLGRALDLLHLAFVLFWLLDRSKDQKATSALLKVFSKALVLAQAALKLPGAWGLLGRVDDALQSGLMPDHGGTGAS